MVVKTKIAKKRGRPFGTGPKLEGISQSEFARRDGCSVSYVSQSIRAHKLSCYLDGSLDPNLVGTGWRRENEKKLERKRAAEMGQEPLPSGLDIEGGLLDTKSAEQVQATYKALKEKRLHDQAIGLVVMVEDTVKEVATAFAKVRTKMLAIAPEHAAQIALLNTPALVKEYLERQITRALEALVEDDDG